MVVTTAPSDNGTKRRWPSAFAVALILFLLINISLWQIYGFCRSSITPRVGLLRKGMTVKLAENADDPGVWGWYLESHPEKCVRSALDFVDKQTAAPDVVLLGSSLTEDPMWALDHEHEQWNPNRFFYHRSRAMEKVLAKWMGEPPVLWNLSTPQLMVSDAYLYVKHYLVGAHRPKMLVFGIAPRDFYDFNFKAPGESVCFGYLTEHNPEEANAGFFHSSLDAARFQFQNSLFLYNKRRNIRSVLESYLWPKEDGEWRRKEIVYHQDLPGLRLTNQNIYKRIYRNISMAALQEQIDYLRKLLSLCKERGIRPVLVFMPMAPSNKNLLPTGLWDDLHKAVSAVAKENNTPVLTPDETITFEEEDFDDGVHLALHGAKKLLHYLEEHPQ